VLQGPGRAFRGRLRALAEPEAEVEVSEWQKLPSKLQLQFYELADGEAEKQAILLKELEEKLDELRSYLESLFKPVPDEDWGELRIAVVDGSSSPAPDTRMLGRYAVYCAGYHVYKGRELVDEGDFKSGVVFRPNEEPGRVSSAVVRLLMALSERELALSCLEEQGVDYVMLDGSFFGFIRDCLTLRRNEVHVKGFGSSEELVNAVLEATAKLVKSDRAFGIVKRVRLRAIDGWSLCQHADEIEQAPDHTSALARMEGIMTGAIDKAILSMLMPTGAWFSYTDLLAGEPIWAFHYYSVLTIWYPFWVRSHGEVLELSKALEQSRRNRMRGFREAFKDEGIIKLITDHLGRHYFKAFDEAPACCLEAPRELKLEPVLSYCAGFANKDTGHPFPLDLMDDDATLPRLFTREFVQEVEARLLDRAVDLEAVRRLFTYLNPQKKWRA